MCINAGSDANNAYKSMVSSLEMVSAVDAVFGSMEDVHVEDMLGELLVKEKSTSRKALSAVARQKWGDTCALLLAPAIGDIVALAFIQ